MSSNAPELRRTMKAELQTSPTESFASGYMLCHVMNFWLSQVVESIDQLTEAYRKANAPVRYIDPHPDR